MWGRQAACATCKEMPLLYLYLRADDVAAGSVLLKHSVDNLPSNSKAGFFGSSLERMDRTHSGVLAIKWSFS